MEEDLTMALDARRKSGLPAALETFNKIQGRNLSTPSFSLKVNNNAPNDQLLDQFNIERENLRQLSFLQTDEKYLSQNPQEINKTIDRFHYLLNDK